MCKQLQTGKICLEEGARIGVLQKDRRRGASAHPPDGKGCSRVGEIPAQSHYTGGRCSFPATITH